MHVCYVTHRYPPQTGGVETHVHQLATRLVERGHDVTVLAADAGGAGASRERRDGVRVRRVRALAPDGAIYVAPGVVTTVWRALRGAVAPSVPDVVHVHNYHAVPFALGGLTTAAVRAVRALRASGDEPAPRLVATPHYHGESDDGLRDRLLSVYRPLGAGVLRAADTVVAVSDWERRQLAADFGVSPTVIPNGIERERFRDHREGADDEERGDDGERGDDEERADDADRPYLLTVGRLAAYKGVQHVIDALAELPAFDLRVAGSGPYESALRERAAAAGVSDRVRFLGYVPDERLPGLYAGAAVFCSPSSHEAYGLTVAEALASGTPAVVADRAALTDWTDERGVVGLAETSPAAVAEAVERAVDGPRPDPDAVPTWTGVVDRLLDVYRH
ncbi:glycosyltransferase family 4 protein [Halobaculum sp. MBLA0147]|uniref:glycosyltransferase family 4 protein n=1 Tax=Halobaculum sp. MBLA0147 TaxID=3079934 RepID=UPI003525BE3B